MVCLTLLGIFKKYNTAVFKELYLDNEARVLQLRGEKPWLWNSTQHNTKGFPGGSDSKESACSAGDLCLIPALGRSPGKGNSYPLQYTGQEISRTEKSDRLHSIVSPRVGHDWVTFTSLHFSSSLYEGFPGGSEGKASACSAGDLGLIPGSGRSPGEGNGNPLQYSCLENPMDREAW